MIECTLMAKVAAQQLLETILLGLLRKARLVVRPPLPYPSTSHHQNRAPIFPSAPSAKKKVQ